MRHDNFFKEIKLKASLILYKNLILKKKKKDKLLNDKK